MITVQLSLMTCTYRVGQTKRCHCSLFRSIKAGFRQFWWFLARERTAHLLTLRSRKIKYCSPESAM